LALQTGGIGAVVRDHFSTFVKYSGGFLRAQAYMPPAQFVFERKQVLLLSGATRTGKTTLAALIDPFLCPLCTPSEQQPWFNGWREGATTALIEEYSPTTRYRLSDLLKLLDSRRHEVPYKGGFFLFNPLVVIITTNCEPEDWYPQEKPETRAALYKRLSYRLSVETSDGAEYQYPRDVEATWISHPLRNLNGTRVSVPVSCTPLQVRSLLSLPPLLQRPDSSLPLQGVRPRAEELEAIGRTQREPSRSRPRRPARSLAGEVQDDDRNLVLRRRGGATSDRLQRDSPASGDNRLPRYDPVPVGPVPVGPQSSSFFRLDEQQDTRLYTSTESSSEEVFSAGSSSSEGSSSPGTPLLRDPFEELFPATDY